ncbi:MAG: gluconate 2-dehydrogenase subunit 3 family protein [Chromatiaceae bacterium]|nr:gluconate 2-dehydrogenase subunit 3 family protein [Chromatiaceae bacterium]
MKRRAFLKAGSLAAFSPALASAHAAGTGAERPLSGRALKRTQWSIIEAVQDHLLPSESDAPGSRDVNATAYLDRTLADPKFDPDVKGFILKGIGWLEEISQQEEGQSFAEVEPAKREDLLRRIADSGVGERWLSTLITYCLEAMLADPLYGGNPGGVGWKWLEHDPGKPRPTPDKIYGRLGKA